MQSDEVVEIFRETGSKMSIYIVRTSPGKHRSHLLCLQRSKSSAAYNIVCHARSSQPRIWCNIGIPIGFHTFESMDEVN